jgi:deoxyribodipyrimidine photolyase-related protein
MILIILPIHLYKINVLKSIFKNTTNNNLLYVLWEHPHYFTKYKFNKKKLILHRSSMKWYEQYLKDRGLRVEYIEYHQPNPYKEFHMFNPIDRIQFNTKYTTIYHPSPSFLMESYEKYNHKSFHFRPFNTFVKKTLNILPNVASKDSMNRKKIPKNANITLPTVKPTNPQKYIEEAITYIKKQFPSNYGTFGSAKDFDYPITHKAAKQMLQGFIKSKLKSFGRYQDAIVPESTYLFHSNLSSSINIGLLTPNQVLEIVLNYYSKHKDTIPINSLEGFVRQVIWREFQRFCYEKHPLLNSGIGSIKPYFKSSANKSLSKHWYDGSLGIEPVDQCIKKAFKNAYLHHIERLMIVGNYMTISGVNPQAGFKWFMEFAIDSYEWVMMQNVYEMVFFTSGGTTTKKPYTTSPAYILRMSSAYSKKDSWVERWGLQYKKFMENNAIQLYRFRAFYPDLRKRHPIRSDKDGILNFPSYPIFTPNLTPYEVLEQGAFGGTYFRKLRSLRTGKILRNLHHQYPWKGLDGDEDKLTKKWESYDTEVNKYKVRVGLTYEEWHAKDWITEWNELGWFHWYCDFYYGKRSVDDERQIKRWTGVNSRFGNRLRKMKRNKKFSPKIAQTLHHWGIVV